LAGHRDLGDDAVVVRVQRWQRLAGLGIGEAAVDEQLVADGCAQAHRGLQVREIHDFSIEKQAWQRGSSTRHGSGSAKPWERPPGGAA
jgi:hypothetical protein